MEKTKVKDLITNEHKRCKNELLTKQKLNSF